MKKWISFLVFMLFANAVFLCNGQFAFAQGHEKVTLYVNSPMALMDEQQTFIEPSDLNVSPIVLDNLTYVPVRFISEAFLADVSWIADQKVVVIRLGANTIEMAIGKKEMTVNGKKVNMDGSARIVNGKTLVPLRAVAVALNKEVFYDRGLIIVSHTKDIYNKKTDKKELDTLISKLNNLPTFGTKENFVKTVGEVQTGRAYAMQRDDVMEFAPQPQAIPESKNAASAPMAPVNDSASSSGLVADSDYSTTNVQVAGVDEADVIKTDGKYIYYVNKGKIS